MEGDFEEMEVDFRQMEVNGDFESVCNMILSFKNKDKLTNALKKLKQFEFKNISESLLPLKTLYDKDISHSDTKSKSLRASNSILKMLYQTLSVYNNKEMLQDVPSYFRDLHDNIKRNTLNTKDLNECIKINNTITNYEKRPYNFPLKISYHRSLYYKYLLDNKVYGKKDLSAVFNISQSTIYAYLSFHDLITEFPNLLYTKLSFRTVMRNLKKMKSILSEHKDLKQFYTRKSDGEYETL